MSEPDVARDNSRCCGPEDDDWLDYTDVEDLEHLDAWKENRFQDSKQERVRAGQARGSACAGVAPAREVKGAFDKMYEETADVVEEFFCQMRIANDITSLDTSKDKLDAVPSADGSLRYQLGEPIRLKWDAPHNHSRKDWVGIYRRQQVEFGDAHELMWVPVHDEEWDGDVPSDLMRRSAGASQNAETASGLVTFKGNTLPWLAGRYEIRFYDGKYNVMALVASVDKPTELSFAFVRANLMRIVPLCLDSDPCLVLLSCMMPEMPATPRLKSKVHAAAAESSDDRDRDDFTFWSEQQAKRICSAIEQVFGVEYAPEVVVADAALARRIYFQRRY
ncbi:hypothetical protein GGX14DRAFT_648690 [Mycena pura]|uniref:Uncharacterized protein n=1 Tax=Mycena pura TaxID=153505 RepID=A0AAD7E1T5_9AGAR|nr:hypothetical protein GGX14DRAFT_648690 [Mycena pura]